MLKTFQYRMYPTKKQARILLHQLEECRWLYNHFLEERQTAYNKHKKTLGYYDQAIELPGLKESRSSLKHVHSQVLQNVAVRLDLALGAFFRRVKTGEKPGYPRFKSFGRYDSMTFPQAPVGCELRDGFLRVSKVGAIPLILHRKLEGRPKTCTIRRSRTGKWFCSFACEVPRPKPLKPSKEQVGIDVGLMTSATLSNGEKIKRKRWFKAEEKNLAKAQRRFSKQARGTKDRRRLGKVVCRIHERIANRRMNFAHQTARKIVNRFDFIAVEDLEVNRMVHDPCYAKGISDVAWSLFFTLLFVKAAEAGRIAVKVNPAYTSQDCSNCGHRQKMPVNRRIYRCPCCNLVLDRDHNAARNILRIGLGLQAVGSIPRSPGL